MILLYILMGLIVAIPVCIGLFLAVIGILGIIDNWKNPQSFGPW